MLSVAHNIVVEGDLMVKMFLERLLCLFLVCRYARYVNDNAETSKRRGKEREKKMQIQAKRYIYMYIPLSMMGGGRYLDPGWVQKTGTEPLTST